MLGKIVMWLSYIIWFRLSDRTQPQFQLPVATLQGTEAGPGKKGRSSLDFTFPHVHHSKLLFHFSKETPPIDQSS